MLINYFKMKLIKNFSLLLSGLLFAASALAQAPQSVARKWNEVLLQAIREDYARPTVHAHNLFHVSMAMYDAWAAYDSVAAPFFLGNILGGFACPFQGVPAPANLRQAREEAISYAAYRLLKHRFKNSPGAVTYLPVSHKSLFRFSVNHLIPRNHRQGKPLFFGR